MNTECSVISDQLKASARGHQTRTKTPPVVSDKLFFEFQVFYLGRPQTQTGNGELGSMLVRALTAEEARFHVEQAGLVVTSVGTGRALVDWSKGYFLRDEVEALACCGSSLVSNAISSGRLKECSGRKGLFLKKNVEEWLTG